MKHKGYTGTAVFSEEDRVFHGKILGINDTVIYDGTTVDELEQNFKDAVDGYLTDCATIGKDPDKEYKGSFNVRIAPTLHREAAITAYKYGWSLNQFMEKATSIIIQNDGLILKEAGYYVKAFDKPTSEATEVKVRGGKKATSKS